MPSPLKYTTTSDGYSIAYSVRGRGTHFVEMPCIPARATLRRCTKCRLSAAFTTCSPNASSSSEYDARGTGNSTRGIGPGHSMLDTFDLEAVVEAAGATSFVLLAHNWPCYTAMRFAEKYPERVSALIMVNPSPMREDVLMPGWREFYIEFMADLYGSLRFDRNTGGDQMREVLASSVTQADFIAIADGGVGHAIEDVIPR